MTLEDIMNITASPMLSTTALTTGMGKTFLGSTGSTPGQIQMLVGTDGVDVVKYSGSIDDYVIHVDGQSVIVLPKSAWLDKAQSVERLEFNDAIYDLITGAKTPVTPSTAPGAIPDVKPDTNNEPPAPQPDGDTDSGTLPASGSSGDELWVGSGQRYGKLSDAVKAAEDGDTIYIKAGVYLNDAVVVDKAVQIIGVGGMAHLKATKDIPNNKAIIIARDDISLENIEFSGAQVKADNGAGIRYEAGDLTIKNSYFHDNQMGILAASNKAGEIRISDSEFARNGTGDGYTHGVYFNEVGKVFIDNSYFHDTNKGHHVKSRALYTEVTNSKLDDAGLSSSYSIDLANGYSGLIKGNLLIQSANYANPTLIAYGAEKKNGGSLTVEDNVLVNYGSKSTGVYNHTSNSVKVLDNTFVNIGTAVKGPASQSGNANESLSSYGKGVLGMTSGPETDSAFDAANTTGIDAFAALFANDRGSDSRFGLANDTIGGASTTEADQISLVGNSNFGSDYLPYGA